MNRALPVAAVLLLVSLAGALWWVFQPPENVPAPLPDSHATPAALNAGSGAGEAQTTAQTSPTIERVHAEDAVTRGSDAEQGLVRVLATWDGEPAPGVQVTLRWSTRERAHRVRAQKHTDSEGRAVFAEVPPGKWSLRSDRGDRKSIDVVPGPQDIAFELEAGVTVTGVVVDPEELPVADAGVWLQTRYTDWSGGMQLATTAADGTFELHHVPTHVSLGAFAKNQAPSPLVDLDTVDTSMPPAKVTLRLAASGGQLVGIVLDQQSRPVPGARVGVGKNDRFYDMRGDRVVEKWSIRSTLTDEGGQFALDGIAAGSWPIACFKDGYGIWRSTCEVAAAGTTEVEVRVQRAGTIFGTVTREGAGPFAGALVRAYDKEPGLDFLAGGQIDWDEMFGHFATVADEQGRYELRGVTAGTAHVFVQPGGRYLRDGPIVHARTELEVPPGGRVEWSPEVGEGLVLDGLVYYRDGHPMKNVFITLTDEKTSKQHVQTNDAKGVFRFVNLDDAVYSVRVQMWDAPDGAPPLQASGLRPGQGRVELRATHDKPVKKEPGTVIGRIDDFGLRIQNPKAVTVTLSSEERWFRDGGKVVDGAFRFDRVTPCRFRLTLMENEAVLAHSDWFELQPGAQLDTGVLRTVPGGSVRIAARRSPGADGIIPKIYLRHEASPRSTVVTLAGDEVLVENLTPGHYKITGYGKGLVSIKGEVEATAGGVADLELDLTAGTLARFDIWVPSGEAVSSYTYRIVTDSGAEFRAVSSAFGSAPTRPFPVAVTMPPGRYTMEFRAQGVLAGSASFTVGTEASNERIRIDLKRE